MRKFDSMLISEDVIDLGEEYLMVYALGEKIYHIDKTKKEIIHSLSYKNGDKCDCFPLLLKGALCNGRVYYAPHFSGQIAVYDIVKKNMEFIDILIDEKIKGGRYSYMYSHDDFLLFLGDHQSQIIKLDSRTNRIDYISDWSDGVEKYRRKDNPWGYFSEGAVMHDDKVLFPLGCIGGMLEVDIFTKSTRLIREDFMEGMNGIGGCIRIGDEIWMTSKGSKNQKIIVWDLNSKCHEEIILDDPLSGMGSYYAPIFARDELYLIPETMDHTYKVSLRDRTARIDDYLDSQINPYGKSHFFGACVVGLRLIDDRICFFSTVDYSWNEYEIETGINKKTWIDIGEVGRIGYNKMFRNHLMDNGLLYEGSFELMDLITTI